MAREFYVAVKKRMSSNSMWKDLLDVLLKKTGENQDIQDDPTEVKLKLAAKQTKKIPLLPFLSPSLLPSFLSSLFQSIGKCRKTQVHTKLIGTITFEEMGMGRENTSERRLNGFRYKYSQINYLL